MLIARLRRLLLHSRRHTYQYKTKGSTEFVFVFGERHTRDIEYIDMSIPLGKSFTDKEAVLHYKDVLKNYNSCLKKREYHKEFLAAYRVHSSTLLIKVKNLKD